ncbi:MULTISPECIES: ATP-binding protein [unclassified Microbacterium]|uniref:ATP-binding protein n=1 Tax=unclassified Microbacterium TaxID=2609290 RepID=UPI00214C9AFD|nr:MULTISPECIES: ATP-binding protein [unclassified Microbacterium]MCR2785197.1 ATP-binding protein [Microbacterium sp. zg.B96]MDL5352559.1 ATP-binding protein [Microbacterium sp. zg-YB36]WIM16730.1 ATP-binding protein [Microbacterium sp. zg-B96]
MPTETSRRVLAEAHGTFGHTADTAAGMATFTRARVARFTTLAVGAGCIMLGAHALLTALASTEEQPDWHTALMIVVFVPLAAMIIACLIGRGVHLAAGVFAVAYPLALLAWPLATAGSPPSPDSGPWIWLLLNVATVAAVLSFPLPLQVAWIVLVPVQYGVVRLAQAGFAGEFWGPVILDVIYAIILGAVLLTLDRVYRAVATRVDQARVEAVASYAAAAAADAAERERVAVAALMHDSVLAALIAAERADSPREHALAVAMAREALTRLANAEQDVGEGPDAPVGMRELVDALERGSREVGVELHVARSLADENLTVPGRVGRALVLAATQAVANAVEHAAAAGLEVTLTDTAQPGGMVIVVHDHGPGFDLATVPDDRLGIRASINARVAAVGGQARVVPTADGTSVTLEWSPSA